MNLASKFCPTFSTGEVCFTKVWRIRFLAGVWCLAAFVLVNAYSSVLISFVTAPYRPYLLHSVQDLYNQSKTSILVDKGFVVDNFLSVSSLRILIVAITEWFSNLKGAETGILKYLKDMLDKGPSIRCKAIEKQKCIAKVKTGSYTYINVCP